MMYGHPRNILIALIIGLAALAISQARGATVPFTEEFVSDAADWRDITGLALVDWVAAGGPDGSSHVSTLFNFGAFSGAFDPVLFRAQEDYGVGGSSGSAFVGDWIAEGISEFSVFARHSAPVPVNFFARFSHPANFPGAVAAKFVPVLTDTWTKLTFDIDPLSPEFISFETTDFATVFSNIGHVQIGVTVPAALAEVDQDYVIDIDKPTIIPFASPLLMGTVGGAVLMLRRRR